MILSRNLSKAFNEQVEAEMWSSNLYLSMSIYFQKAGLNGCAHWMRKQAEEDIEINQINVVPTAWGTPLEVFEHVYKHEVHVSELIDKMVDIAETDNDHAAKDFLYGFVREQVEEESSAKAIVDQLKMYGEHHAILLDHKLGKR